MLGIVQIVINQVTHYSTVGIIHTLNSKQMKVILDKYKIQIQIEILFKILLILIITNFVDIVKKGHLIEECRKRQYNNSKRDKDVKSNSGNSSKPYEAQTLNSTSAPSTSATPPKPLPYNDHNSNVKYVLHPRTETLVKIKVINAEIQNGICPDLEILQGVHLCPSIVKVIDQNHAITSILNTTEKFIDVHNIEVILEPIPSELQVYKVSQLHPINANSNSDRLNKISNLLRTSHLNNEERQFLINICHKYNHIFYLEGDNLSCHLQQPSCMRFLLHLKFP